MAAGSLTLGGNMSLAVGPLGRNGEASTALSTTGKVAAMFVPYRHCPFEFCTDVIISGTVTRKLAASLVASLWKAP
jgi:hypothetical protein